jgi:hypothetical protein
LVEVKDQAGEQLIKLNTAALANGEYFVKLNTSAKQTAVKMVVVH